MNKCTEALMKRTGKPYGGHIDDCIFRDYDLRPREIDGLTHVTIAYGNLRDDPRNRFGVFGNRGMHTSYIARKSKNHLETRNTIYTYTEREVPHETDK